MGGFFTLAAAGGAATVGAVVGPAASFSAAGGGLGLARSSSAAGAVVVAAVRVFPAVVDFGCELLPGRKSTVIVSPAASWRSPCSRRTASLTRARYGDLG